MNLNGCILYDGPSMLDGNRIVVILTGLKRGSKNSKTGALLQTWIFRADRDPIATRRAGNDYSICGDCPHRTGSCYVNLSQGPLTIWRCYNRGRYARHSPQIHNPLIEGRQLRFGSYGDPAAAPISAFLPIIRLASRCVGYTHQWRRPLAEVYRPYLMASADCEADADLAVSMGWRYFLVTQAGYAGRAGAINCPASEEQGKRTSCERCMLCCGSRKSKAPSVWINAHGAPSHRSIYYNRTLVQIGH